MSSYIVLRGQNGKGQRELLPFLQRIALDSDHRVEVVLGQRQAAATLSISERFRLQQKTQMCKVANRNSNTK